ncbi:MAG: hypothetical protein H0W73_04785 [Bacteroidetes bacterium]|nr:hypothetical protein [Bacteroidota bacterium]
MTKKHLQKLWLFLISGLAITTITVLACGGGDWDGTEGSMFTPEIINQPKYKPFFRTQATPFYDGYDDASAGIFKEQNIKDWMTYLGNNLSKEAVNYWLYEASLNQIDSMIFDIKKKPATLTSKSQSYSLKTIQPENKATGFLYFVGFAKRNENFVAKEINYWGDEPKKKETVSIVKQIAGGVNFLAKATDPFMKERYAFQLERLYFFNKDYTNTIKVYKDNEAIFKTEDNLKWRSLSYCAGAYYKQKQYAQANYIFSKIYDNFAPLQKSAYLSFHPLQQADWNECLGLAKSTREKEVLWQMFGLYNDYVTAIKEILKLNPKSEMADVLLVRAVNIEEEKFTGIEGNDLSKQKDLSDKIDKSLVTFLNEMSANNTTNNPVIWHLSAAYLNYIKKDFSTGDKQIKLAEKYSKTTNIIKAQYHLISIVGKVSRITELNPKAEAELLTDLKVLFKDKMEEAFRPDAARLWIRSTLAKLAIQKNEHDKAEMIFNGVEGKRFEKIENLKSMIAYWDKENKSEFEKLFSEVSSLTKFNYQELLGIRYTQNDQLEDALRTFKTIPKYNNELLGNPFTIHIKDCHDCDHEAKQNKKYNSISFVEKLIEMKGMATTKPAEAGQNYFLMANGFYNMTYFGNARYFYNNKVNNSGYYFDEEAHSGEMNCDLALKYYLLAKEKTTDKELQAKCTFMAAKCEQNAFFMNKPKSYKGDFKAGIYFAQLKKEFNDTKYYQEIIKECGYYRKYIGR